MLAIPKSLILTAFTFILHCLAFAQANVYGTYLEFNGNSVATDGDFVEIPDNSLFDFDHASSFTIQFWVNPSNFVTAPNTLQGLVTKKTASGIGYGVFWDVTAGGNGRFQLLLKETGASGSSSKSVSTSTIANINSLGWTHVTMVVQRNIAPATDSAFIYLNSTLEARSEIAAIGDLSNSQPLRFMNYAGNTTNNCAGGSLDEVRIWNVALTPKQIQRFYSEPIKEITTGILAGKIQGAFTGKRSFIRDWADLVGYWNFEEAVPAFTVTDQSTSTVNGQLFEGAGGTPCNIGACGPEFRLFGGPSYDPKETFVSISTGDWSNASTWSGGNIPNSSRALVFIKDGHTVTIDGTFRGEDIQVEPGAILTSTSSGQLEVEKYLQIDGELNCKTTGLILFTGASDHRLFGEGDFDFFHFEISLTSQLKNEIDARFANIYGVLSITDGRLRTEDRIALRVNKSNISRPYGLISPISIGTPDVRGEIVMEKQLSNNNAGWRQMSMPLVGNLSDFTGMPLRTSSFPSEQQNVFFWDNTSNPGTPANNIGWTSASANAGHVNAYSIYLDDNNFSFSDTILFRGEYAFGDTTYVLTYFNDPGNPIVSGQVGYENGVGWNFIPNRYASLLDVQQMITDNPLNYKSIHIWDANTQQYVAFTDNPGDFIVPYNNAGTGAAELSAAAIEPMQGFWVKTDNTENGTSFIVEDDWRSTNFGLNPHTSLKNTTLVQVNVFSAIDSSWDGTAFVLNEYSTHLFDPQKDVYKLRSESNVPSLFLEKDYRFMQIGYYPSSTSSIRMHFLPQRERPAGQYYLHLHQPLPNDQVLIVEDLITGHIHNLSKTPYQFWSEKGQESGRFKLHVLKGALADEFLNNPSDILAYATNGLIHISAPFIIGPFDVRIIDTSGRCIAKYDRISGNNFTIPDPLAHGMVLLELRHKGGIEVVKISLTR